MSTAPMNFGGPNAPVATPIVEGTATFGTNPTGGTRVNPTGANGTGGTTAPWGTVAPPTGSPGNYGYGVSMNPTGTATPAPPGDLGNFLNLSNPGGYGGEYSALGNNLGKVYGKGIGGAVESFLDSGGGYNLPLTEQAVQAQVAQMQLQANQNFGNLQSGLGEAGINPNSSAAALESSNFWSNTTAAENAMTAQEFFNMWQSSMSNETSVLETAMGGASQEKMNQPSGFDWATLGLSAGSSGAELGMMAAGMI